MNGAAGTRKKEKASYGRAKKNGEKKSKKGAEGFSSGGQRGKKRQLGFLEGSFEGRLGFLVERIE